PRTTSFAVVALRSVAGSITGAHEVVIESLGRRAAVDAHGDFVFRSLPAGRLSLTAKIGGRTVTHELTMPAEPVTLRDITFEAGVPAAAVAEARPPAIATAGGYVVQIGAFRDPGNARQLTIRLERIGEAPFTDRGEGLLLVRTGPFVSRTIATAAVNRLRRAGIESYVLSR
ncbi:MAG TPA: SPOR domain-containing protein, partial [Thermoanaerobaculia bacterium]